jgi:hypothetical protein
MSDTAGFADKIAHWQFIVSRAESHSVGRNPLVVNLSRNRLPEDIVGAYWTGTFEATAPRAECQPALIVTEPTAAKAIRFAAAKRAKAAHKATRRART